MIPGLGWGLREGSNFSCIWIQGGKLQTCHSHKPLGKKSMLPFTVSLFFLYNSHEPRVFYHLLSFRLQFVRLFVNVYFLLHYNHRAKFNQTLYKKKKKHSYTIRILKTPLNFSDQICRHRIRPCLRRHFKLHVFAPFKMY